MPKRAWRLSNLTRGEEKRLVGLSAYILPGESSLPSPPCCPTKGKTDALLNGFRSAELEEGSDGEPVSLHPTHMALPWS